MIDLTQIPFEELAAEYGRRCVAMRETLGGGRPKLLSKCPKGCGQMFGAREMKQHTPRCTGKKRSRKATR